MFLSEKTPLVAVDIGSHSIKLAQLIGAKNRFELKNFGIMPLKEGCIVDGMIRRPDEVIEAVTTLLKAEKVSTKYSVASVAGEAVIIKKIKVPVMSEEELAENINSEAEQYIPFDIDDVSLDYQVLNPRVKADEDEEEKMEILLVAVQNEIIDSRRDILLDAGLRPVIIDLDVFALVNALSLGVDLPQMEPVGVIDLGDSFTHLNILSHGTLGYTRDVPSGGCECTHKLMNKFQIPFQQAEEIKRGKIPSTMDPEEVSAVIIESFQKIVQEVQKSFEFFSTTSNTQVERVFLSGGGALIHGVDGYFSEQLKMPVEVLDPFKSVKINSKNFDQETLQQLAPLGVVAVGLATRRFDYK